MPPYLLFIAILSSQYVEGSFGPFRQTYDYVTVREGAHMFYWLFYTTADVANYTDRPLIVWLQGGPGGSSTATGNFEILGPLDLRLQERNHTWIKNFNVLFVDNPVGAGFSYVSNLTLLTTTNDEIALDFVELMKGFFRSNPEFEGIPLYIYGQSYGGNMAVDMAIRMREAEQANEIRSNLKGIAMGNAWISPVDATLTWGPLLLAAGLVDQEGYESIQREAREAERLFNEGQYVASTNQWARTQRAVFSATTSVDFYDILTKRRVTLPDTRSSYELSRDMMIRDRSYGVTRDQEEVNLADFMNTQVKPALGIPDHVVWGSQSNDVFDYQRGDFMKPVTDGIEKLLNETDIILQKYNGNLDLICDTPGQILWVDRLKWPGAEAYKQAPRNPIWENDRLEGYYKAYGNFRFFWINVAGHSSNQQGNLKGVLLGNGIIAPALAMTRLGFYLEELAYIDGNGRAAVEQLSNDINALVQEGKCEDAFDEFTQLGDFVNERAGAIAVNMRHIIDKLTRNSTGDFFGHSSYLNKEFSSVNEAHRFMDTVVASGLGIPDDVTYDAGRDDAIKAFRNFLMNPATEHVEEILENAEIPVVIYNGNLDAVSNTPGQLEWVNNLSWSGQQQFLNSTRNTLVINSYIEGYFRESPRLTFYWVNVAGQAAPMENPVAVRTILDRTTSI